MGLRRMLTGIVGALALGTMAYASEKRQEIIDPKGYYVLDQIDGLTPRKDDLVPVAQGKVTAFYLYDKGTNCGEAFVEIHSNDSNNLIVSYYLTDKNADDTLDAATRVFVYKNSPEDPEKEDLTEKVKDLQSLLEEVKKKLNEPTVKAKWQSQYKK